VPDDPQAASSSAQPAAAREMHGDRRRWLLSVFMGALYAQGGRSPVTQLRFCDRESSILEVMRVLLVEDHAKLALTVAAGLRRLGMAVDVAFDGEDALAHAAVTNYDVVVLDRDLPKVHGDEVCRRLVDEGHDCHVLMLTAAGAVAARVQGLRMGADDYLPKPFDASELVARIESLARRSRSRRPAVLASGELTLDPGKRLVKRAGRRLALNPKEFAVLEQLLYADGAVVSAEELLMRVWDENADPFSHVVKTTMSRLRAKLGRPEVIETVAKSGYRIRG